MTYRIRYRKEVLQDLREIPADIEKRIRRAIENRLGVAPDRYGDRLGKDLKGLWKLRVGDYRIVFELDVKDGRVTVWAIRHRRNVYPETFRRRHG